MKITWYGHSCFAVDSDVGRLVFDPYSDGSVPGWTLPQLTADAVLCSHGHSDHAGTEKVTLSGRETSCTVETVDCFHDEVRGAKRGKNVIHIVTAENTRIVHLGDLGHELSDGQLEQIGKPDVLFIPVGGFYTIDAATAKRVADSIAARITVPMHYSGESFGYDVITRLDEYTALCGDVVQAPGSSFDPADYTGRVTLVLKAHR